MIEKLILISLGLIVALYAISLANWPWVILGLMVAASAAFLNTKRKI